jgi:hypothetical protein
VVRVQSKIEGHRILSIAGLCLDVFLTWKESAL